MLSKQSSSLASVGTEYANQWMQESDHLSKWAFSLHAGILTPLWFPVEKGSQEKNTFIGQQEYLVSLLILYFNTTYYIGIWSFPTLVFPRP